MAKKGSVFGGLRQFDGYAKTLDDFRVKTTTGASGNNYIHLTSKTLLLTTQPLSYRHQHTDHYYACVFRINRIYHSTLETKSRSRQEQKRKDAHQFQHYISQHAMPQ